MTKEEELGLAMESIRKMIENAEKEGRVLTGKKLGERYLAAYCEARADRKVKNVEERLNMIGDAWDMPDKDRADFAQYSVYVEWLHTALLEADRWINACFGAFNGAVGFLETDLKIRESGIEDLRPVLARAGMLSMTRANPSAKARRKNRDEYLGASHAIIDSMAIGLLIENGVAVTAKHLNARASVKKVLTRTKLMLKAHDEYAALWAKVRDQYATPRDAAEREALALLDETAPKDWRSLKQPKEWVKMIETDSKDEDFFYRPSFQRMTYRFFHGANFAP